MKNLKDDRVVIVSIEPSKRLSEICGFPYFIERKFTVKELLEKKIINKKDLEKMEKGEIHKLIKGEKSELKEEL